MRIDPLGVTVKNVETANHDTAVARQEQEEGGHKHIHKLLKANARENPEATAKEAARIKFAEVQDRDKIDHDTMKFVPFAMDTEGAMNKQAEKWMKKCCLTGARLKPGLSKAIAGSVHNYAAMLYRRWWSKITLVMKKFTARAIIRHTRQRLEGKRFKGKIDALFIDATEALM